MPEARKRRSRLSLRAWLRAIHRDVGYFVVGLTFIYALSGLAVNHIGDWDPNFTQIDQKHQLGAPLPTSPEAAASAVLAALDIQGAVEDVYALDDREIEIVLEHRTLRANTKTGVVIEEGQEPRFFLRAANWLHLNRGKEAWTIVADGYALLLLYLATSGLFMLPGPKGLKGRGAFIAAAGALVPIAYVTLSGGP